MKITIIAILIFLMISRLDLAVQAQPENTLGTWSVLVLKTKISGKFSFTGEFNFRNSEFGSTYNHSEYKLSFIYTLNKKLGISAGGGQYNNNSEGNFFNPPRSGIEYRLWEDILFKHAYGRFFFDHRCRLEQRFLYSDYRNRLRYKFNIAVPFNKPALTEKAFYLTSFDEFFFVQDNPVYEANKFYAALGYNVTDSFTLQLGMVRVQDYKSEGAAAKNYIQATVIYNLKNHHFLNFL